MRKFSCLFIDFFWYFEKELETLRMDQNFCNPYKCVQCLHGKSIKKNKTVFHIEILIEFCSRK